MKFHTVVLYTLLFITAYYIVDAVISTNAAFKGYKKWSPANSTRNDMYCPENCYNNPEEDERCCCCRAVTCWELDAAACNVTVGQLSVGYKDIYGSAIFVPSGNHTLYEAVHTHGRLTKFPDNLCNFADSLVKLDLSYNRIGNISDIRCLNKLDILRLDGNKITNISNDTFSNMEYLRVVSLTRNRIEILHPNTNKKNNGNILMADFSYNIVESMDITNFIRPGQFCNMSKGCEINGETNLLKYFFNDRNSYGLDNIMLNPSDSEKKSHFYFNTFAAHDYTKLGHYIKGNFGFEGSYIKCECCVVPFCTGLGEQADKYWPRIGNYYHTFCVRTENVKGRNLTNMNRSKLLVEQACELPVFPPNCLCKVKPSENYIKVQHKELTSTMSDHAPVRLWKNARTDLDSSDSSNKIFDFPNKEYMSRLIQTLDVDAIQKLAGNVQIDLSDHNLKTLPVAFQKLNPNRIKFGSKPVECNCDNLWIGDWIRNNWAQGKLQCSTSKGDVPAERVTSGYLQCFNEENVENILFSFMFVLVASIFPLIGMFVYGYGCSYEILLIKRKFINNRAKKHEYQFDAMLTFSEDNPEIFRWIERGIVPTLKREGYSLFVPFYDLIFGGNREKEIAKGVGKSRNYIVFLCNKYLCNENTVQEFEMLWRHFRMDTTKKIIVINFGNITASEIRNWRLRAIMQIQDDLKLTEGEGKLYGRLKRRLGPPRRKRKRNYSENDDHLLDCVIDTVNDQENKNGVDQTKDNRNLPWYDRLACFAFRKWYLHAKDS